MKFVQVCSNVYGTEEKFCEKVKPILQELLAGLDVELDRRCSEESDARKAVTSDFTVIFTIGGVKIALVNFELKRDIAGSKSNPDIQNIGYVMKFKKGLQGHAAPMLLVSLAGFLTCKQSVTPCATTSW